MRYIRTNAKPTSKQHVSQTKIISPVNSKSAVSQVEKQSQVVNVIGIIINFALAIVAVVVLIQTRKQTQAAVDSARAAKDAVKLTKQALEFSQMTYFETSRESERNNAKSEVNYQRSLLLSEQSVRSSLRSLDLTQRNFNTENKPYIFFTALVLDSISPNKPIKLSVHFANSGKTPALLMGLKKNFKIDSVNTLRSIQYSSNNIVRLNHYQQPNTIYIDHTFTTDYLNEKGINLFRENKLFLFYYGEILYKNVVNNKFSIYKFCFRFRPDGRFDITRNHNGISENVDVSVLEGFN